jgi:RNA polymerase sigma-70 factor (ECF subfamily)
VVRLDELRLIKLIRRSGDRTAADELVRYYYDEIHGFVRKQVSGADVSLDLTQEIFVSMLGTIAHFTPNRGASFRTWLYKIAANKVVDWFRSRSHKELTVILPLDDAEPIDESDFTQKFADRDFAERVCAIVGKLPPDTQKIFRLHIFGEHTFAEIADALKAPEGSVKSKYYRLINLLRKEFSDYE